MGLGSGRFSERVRNLADMVIFRAVRAQPHIYNIQYLILHDLIRYSFNRGTIDSNSHNSVCVMTCEARDLLNGALMYAILCNVRSSVADHFGRHGLR